MDWTLKGLIQNISKRVFSPNAEDQTQQYKRLIIMRHGHEMNHSLLESQVNHSAQEYFKYFPASDFDAILHSPTQRTTDTAQSVYNFLDTRNSQTEDEKNIHMQEALWLSDDKEYNMNLDEMGHCIQMLDDEWDTVCLVTHSTKTDKIAKAVSTQANDDEIRYVTGDYACMLVLDLPVKSWTKAPNAKTNIALAIGQKETLKASEIMPAFMSFMGINL